MPRKPKPEIIEHSPKPVPEATPTVPDAPSAFKAVATAAWRPNTRGRVSPYKPLYTPNGVKLAMFLAPGGFLGSADYQQARFNGWLPLPKELVTNDPEVARTEGKVALLHYEIGPDGLVRVGEHVVMFQLEKEWYEKYYADLRALEAVTNMAHSGVTVHEWSSREEEAPIGDV